MRPRASKQTDWRVNRKRDRKKSDTDSSLKCFWTKLRDCAAILRVLEIFVLKKSFRNQVQRKTKKRRILKNETRLLYGGGQCEGPTQQTDGGLIPGPITDHPGAYEEIEAVIVPCVPRITNRRTDGPADRRTDRPSFRDARTNLKSPMKGGLAQLSLSSFA